MQKQFGDNKNLTWDALAEYGCFLAELFEEAD